MSAPRPTLSVVPSEGFVLTPALDDLVQRANTYLDLGYPVHLCGPSGTGKTTLALHIAAQLGRPVALLHGDDSHATADLVGRNVGTDRHRVVDNYIAKVHKTTEKVRPHWTDGRLTSACRQGHTLVYDEFTRSRAEANNALLSVIEEGLVDLGGVKGDGAELVRVHPDFRMVLTSNPREYEGTHGTQDALLDRMVTLHVLGHDRSTEVAIVGARTGIGASDAGVIVDIVRDLRARVKGGPEASLRGAIALARVLVQHRARALADDPVFTWASRDLLGGPLLRADPRAFEAVEAAVGRIAPRKEVA